MDAIGITTLRFTPFLIHMMRKKISRLACMYDNIRLRNSTSLRIADAVQFKFLEMLLYKHVGLGIFCTFLITPEDCCGNAE